MAVFYGKYRGKVENNIDPEGRGRLQVSVPAVLGDSALSWAMPCVPYAGSSEGFFTVPPTGANVWVEFENGNPNYPIWTGCFWGRGEAPVALGDPQVKTLTTPTASITLNDGPGGGITIETTSGMKIAMTATGIEISDGTGGTLKISQGMVSLNNGALEVR